jgi:ABC-type branched-subunit amino acid transport system ATPase component/MFS family permease
MRRSSLQRLGAGASLFPLVILLSLELLDQATKSAFSILTPNIRDAFHLSNSGILAITAIGDAAALGCTIPIALLADRSSRIRILLVGAVLGALFSFALGLAPTVLLATLSLVGTRMGEAVIFPTHNSLLADYYPVRARPRIYYTHRGGSAVGAVTGVLLGAGLADAFSWRAPFLLFTIPVVVVVVIGTSLREPSRGRYEQLALAEETIASEPGHSSAASEDLTIPEQRADGEADLEEQREYPPSFGEAWRMVWKIGVLRRIFFALPLLSASLAGFASLASLQYQQTFHLDVTERAFLMAPVQVFQLSGLAVGAIFATRLAAGGMKRVFTMLGVAALVASSFSMLFALAPSVPIAFVANAGIEASLAVVGPGVLAALSLAIPARARSIGFAISALFVLPGLVVLPIVGVFGDAYGFRYGMLLLAPVFAAGGLIVASAGNLIDRDIHNVWVSMQARAKMRLERRAGRLPLLAVRNISVGYDGVTVLRDVDLEVAQGEIVALLGTNGAGKSTLLRAIGGVVEAGRGAIIFDGRDITHMPPDEIARLGIAQVPGGAGVFPTLTVGENLRAASWQRRGESTGEPDLVHNVFEVFPGLEDRKGERAGNLSGGQQQMLSLAMALLSDPKLLLIDELSLGLAPIVVEQLLASVQELRNRGTAILLVEQSVDVAVSVADRGYVMDNGLVRFSGTAEEISARPDLLWSIYLHNTAAGLTPGPPAPRRDQLEDPTLEVTGVSISFGGITAVNDVSLAVSHGEVLGIIGPNGAGKTTLFDLLSGFERPSEGRILLHGVDVTHRDPAFRARLGLGRSFQD